MAESRFATGGQAFTQEVRKRVSPQRRRDRAPATLHVARRTWTRPSGNSPECQTYAVAAFASVGANRGSVGLLGELPHAVETIVATGKPVALVALGNPYLLRSFPHVTSYLATFSTVPPSEIAAVRALFGEINIRGHLPVSIPGLAAIRGWDPGAGHARPSASLDRNRDAASSVLMPGSMGLTLPPPGAERFC